MQVSIRHYDGVGNPECKSERRVTLDRHQTEKKIYPQNCDYTIGY